MLKTVIGAAIGSKMAKNSALMGSTTGAMIGAAIPLVLSRLSLPAMLAMGAGGYLAKRHFDRKQAQAQANGETGKDA